MARDGSGTYTLPPGNPVVTLTTISTLWANSTLSDIANEITNSIDKAGRTVPTANLPMGGFRHTGAGAATVAGMYLVHSQAAMGPISASTLSASGAATLSSTLAVTGAATFASTLGVTGAITGGTYNGQTISAAAAFTGTVSVAGALTGAGSIISTSASNTGGQLIRAENTNAGTGAFARVQVSNGSQSLAIDTYGTGHSGGFANQSWIYTVGAQPLILGTVGTERLRIDTAGNVGIGGVPTTELHVFGDSVTEARLQSSGDLTASAASLLRFGGSNSATSGYVGFGGSASRLDLVNALNGPLTFFTNNTERARFDGAGWLALGATSRASIGSGADLLAVNGNIGFTTQLNGSPGTNNPMEIVNRSTNGPIDLYPAGSFRARFATDGSFNLVAGAGSLRTNGHISRFESAEQTCPTTGNTNLAVSHGGSRRPDIAQVVLRCVTAEAGYAIGDEVVLNEEDNGATDRIGTLWTTTANVNFYWVSAANNPPAIRNRSTGALVTVTAGNWRLVFKCLWL